MTCRTINPFWNCTNRNYADTVKIMLTNIVATVVTMLVTNTTEIYPTRHWQTYAPDPHPETGGKSDMAGYIQIDHSEPIANPTNKTVITTVVERSITTFELFGLPEHLTNDVPVSTSEVGFRRTESWVADTNAPTTAISTIQGSNCFPYKATPKSELIELDNGWTIYRHQTSFRITNVDGTLGLKTNR